MADLSKVASRKWQITINNPLEHGFSHEEIIRLCSSIRGNVYFCLCDEEGDECETLHTHVFICRASSALTAERIQSLFPNMHREKAFGAPYDNRCYILKDGEKFHKDSDGHYSYDSKDGKHHEGINFSDTFFESGECPDEHQGKSSSDDLIIDLIRNGASNEDIIESVSSAFKHIDKIERVRSMFRDREFSDKWRDLHVTYISGKTGIGKTRSVMEKFGFSNVFRVTDYKHPFDTYNAQDIILFEEFRSSLPLGDMLNYLDGYPLLLPCRYFDRQACFTKVFLISNIPVSEQYLRSDRESRQAFFRRIHEVQEFDDKGRLFHYRSVDDYIHKTDWWFVDDPTEVKKLP